jgi:hypothetical protein
MTSAKRAIWQQAAGDTDRDYSNLCLKWDVILYGPGRYGEWPKCKEPMCRAETSRQVSILRRFADDMKEGDLVVLRMGTASVRGVGEIVGPYEWHDAFGDIDGWDLQHVRRVRWIWQGDRKFNAYDLKWGDTTQKLSPGPVWEWALSLSIAEGRRTRSLEILPPSREQRDIPFEHISEFLFDRGVSSASIENLQAEFDELIRIAKWYNRTPNKPSEHETVAYLVVPLLRALGWTPQRMAVEWNRVDLALFAQLPRDDKSLCVVVEAKKMNNSCLRAQSQAEAYAQGRDGCHRLIVTDGVRYGVYVRHENEVFRLHAYLNITRLRQDYPIYACLGAQEALLTMAPEWENEVAETSPELEGA